MAEVKDGYDTYYANRLWQLLPGVYRAMDSDDPNVSGPLQELVIRIGAQVAVVRRSIDRLRADQSIETCDDWVIPYIGDLLGTNLVAPDARARRLDVAKTIHYRRRKGTLAILEEIARDVTGWDAHVVEAFRRLSRTRHNLDPAVGPASLVATLPAPCPGSEAATDQPDPSRLLTDEGLIGPLTATPAGGFADLRSGHGATLADSPFDEYFHTADMRLGEGAVGRYGIPKLLVFVWRLQSFAILAGTPVPVTGCPGQFVFDPTGRQVPLFLAPLAPEADDWADTWVSAPEWDVPGPLTSSLQRAIADQGGAPPRHAPYPDAHQIPTFYSARAGTPAEPAPISAWPDVGQFELQTAPVPAPLTVSYQYGFPAAIGAGPYDRTLLGDPPGLVGSQNPVSGGSGLDAALGAAVGDCTVTIGDSLTYEAIADVGSTVTPIASLLIRAGADERPVIRPSLPSPHADGVVWTFTGGDSDSQLTLDGLLISGADIVLRGAFASVRITGCTTDPGSLNDAGDGFALSVDGRELAPAQIWIEADPLAAPDAPGGIASLVVDHCVLGPLRTRNGGAVEAATISDSIIQGLAPDASGALTLTASDVYDPKLLVESLSSADPVSVALVAAMSGSPSGAMSGSPPGGASGSPPDGAGSSPPHSLEVILDGLNDLITGPHRLDAVAPFAGVPLDPELSAILASGATPDLAAVNRALLVAAFPVALSPAALAVAQRAVALMRVSVIGRTFVHRLSASDSILADFTVVEDCQDGCIRFSAVAHGSVVPRQYESVTVGARANLFTSSAYGNPAYGQLLETADRAILPGGTGGSAVPGAATPSVAAGAETGSEMGAFSSQLAPVKERGLLLKYSEYMPLGLTPVVVHVT